jgi:uncharacterized membrane protein YqaE (UPF0057 family)
MGLKSDKQGNQRKPAFVIALIILAVIFPPLAVLLDQGCHEDLLINILLTILGWFPGVIHAFYILAVREPKSILQDHKPSDEESQSKSPQPTNPPANQGAATKKEDKPESKAVSKNDDKAAGEIKEIEATKTVVTTEQTTKTSS